MTAPTDVGSASLLQQFFSWSISTEHCVPLSFSYELVRHALFFVEIEPEAALKCFSSSTSSMIITLHCRGSWSLLAAPQYDLLVIKPISITQWTWLPWCVHSPRWSQTHASSWGETWIADFFFLHEFLTLPKTWVIKSCALRLLFLLLHRNTLKGHCLCCYASSELSEKKGLLFGSALIPPFVAYVWFDRKMSVFAGNGRTNPTNPRTCAGRNHTEIKVSL